MRYRTLEIIVRSARHLKNVNYISKMDVYAIVSIISGPGGSGGYYRTCVDRAGGTNPTWNFPIHFSVDESSAAATLLVINLRCERALGDKDIGEIRVPIKDLLCPAAAGEMKPKFVTYQVTKAKPSGTGKSRGELLFSYKWAARSVEETVTPYPVSSGKYDVDPYPAPAGTGLYPKIELDQQYTYQHPYPYSYPYPYPYPHAYNPPPTPPYPYQYPHAYNPPPTPPPQQGYAHPVRPGYGYYPPVQGAATNRFGSGLVGGAL